MKNESIDKLREHKGNLPFAHDTSVAVAPSSLSGAYNRCVCGYATVATVINARSNFSPQRHRVTKILCVQSRCLCDSVVDFICDYLVPML